MIVIYENATSVKSKYPMRPDLIQRNRRYTHRLIVFEAIALLIIKLIWNNPEKQLVIM